MCLVFWAVLAPQEPSIITSASTIHVHLINAIVIVIDLWMNAMPMQLLHIYQPVLYGSAYVIFSAVYFGVQKGTGPDGKPYVYPIIQDYVNHPRLSVGADVVMVLVLIPIVWFGLWLTHKLRVYLWKNYDPDWRGNYDLLLAWEDRFRGLDLAVVSEE